jgi:integrase
MIAWFTGFLGRSLRGLSWDQVELDAGTVTFDRPKKQEVSRCILIAANVVRLFERLWEIRAEDCDWVFPSRRVVGDQCGPLDALDRLPKTAAGDLRHFWMSTALEIAPRHVHRWLPQQKMTDDDLRMLGHYGEQTPDKQKRSATAIANSINKKFGLSPANVVEIRPASAQF